MWLQWEVLQIKSISAAADGFIKELNSGSAELFKIIFQMFITFSCFDHIKYHIASASHRLGTQCNLKHFRLYPFHSHVP